MTTTQEIFDIVWAHAHTMNGPCRDDLSFGMLRNREGSKCFIGALIADEDYKPELEDRYCNVIDNIAKGIDDMSRSDGSRFLHKLRSAHDGPTSHSVEWKKAAIRELIRIAEEYTLIIPDEQY